MKGLYYFIFTGRYHIYDFIPTYCRVLESKERK